MLGRPLSFSDGLLSGATWVYPRVYMSFASFHTVYGLESNRKNILCWKQTWHLTQEVVFSWKSSCSRSRPLSFACVSSWKHQFLALIRLFKALNNWVVFRPISSTVNKSPADSCEKKTLLRVQGGPLLVINGGVITPMYTYIYIHVNGLING